MRLVTTQSTARPQARSAIRRREVLDAALACFAEKGIDETAIEDICALSGASVGSIYHLFGNKAGVAAALYLDALADFQGAVSKQVRPAMGAQEGVHALIAAHIKWVEKNRTRAQFLHETRHAGTVAAHAEEIRALNREFWLALAGWAQAHIASGALRPMPSGLFIAQLLGPTHEYVRGRLAGRESAPLKLGIKLLGEAAWRALGIEEKTADSKHSGGKI